MSSIPEDVRKELEKSGAVFDENGNMIEDNFFKNLNASDEDDENDDSSQNEDDTSETQIAIENNTSNDDEDDDSSEEDENDEINTDNDSESENKSDEDKNEESKSELKNKLTKKNSESDKKSKLTPKKSETDNSELEELRQKVDNLRSELFKSSTDENISKKSDDQKETELFKKLEEEREEFKKFRMRQLASQLENQVNKDFSTLGVSFKDIIQSEEWSEYLNTKKYGNPIKDYYANAISNSDWDSMIGFFDDFKSIYLKDSTSDNTKPKLDDLVVSEKSKVSKKPPKKTKYDFSKDDYIEMVNKLERGRISIQEFDKFEEKYDKANKQGRVKSS